MTSLICHFSKWRGAGEERCYVWPCSGPARKNSWGTWSSRETLSAVTMKWWSLISSGQWGWATVSSVPVTLGKQTLGSSGTCLVEYCEIKPWREEKESWLIISYHFLQDQGQCSPVKGKLGKNFQEACMGEVGAPWQIKHTKEAYRGGSKDR